MGVKHQFAEQSVGFDQIHLFLPVNNKPPLNQIRNSNMEIQIKNEKIISLYLLNHLKNDQFYPGSRKTKIEI